MDGSKPILAGVRRRPSDVVQKFLRSLLAVVAAAVLRVDAFLPRMERRDA